MTLGWKPLVVRKKIYEAWIPLMDMKESNPVDVAKFSKAKVINGDMVFSR